MPDPLRPRGPRRTTRVGVVLWTLGAVLLAGCSDDSARPVGPSPSVAAGTSVVPSSESPDTSRTTWTAYVDGPARDRT